MKETEQITQQYISYSLKFSRCTSYNYAREVALVALHGGSWKAHVFLDMCIVIRRCEHRLRCDRARAGRPRLTRGSRYDAQIQMLQAECDRNTQMATAQFQQQYAGWSTLRTICDP